MNLKNKNKQIYSTGAKGFTLVEVIIAMFIFTLVMSSSSLIFAKAFRVYGDAKDIQANMENAQYAMNLMAKTFRTSSVANSDSNSVTVFDYSQAEGGNEGKCIRYFFSANSIRKAVNNATTLNDCEGTTPSAGAAAITSGDVTAAHFDVTSSVVDDTVGKITVSMTLEKGNNEVHVQTTTSLRDYIESGISL